MKKTIILILLLQLILLAIYPVYGYIEFTDVNKTDWFYMYLEEILLNNPKFANRFSNNKFEPNKYIHFEEFLEWISELVLQVEDYTTEDGWNCFRVRDIKIPENDPNAYMLISKTMGMGLYRSPESHLPMTLLDTEKNYRDYIDYGVLYGARKDFRNKTDLLLNREIMGEIIFYLLKFIDVEKTYYDDVEYMKEYRNSSGAEYRFKKYEHDKYLLSLEERNYMCKEINDLTNCDKEILYTIKKGILTLNNKKYNKKSFVTRAEALTAIYRIINYEKIQNMDLSCANQFNYNSDVPDLTRLQNHQTQITNDLYEMKERYDWLYNPQRYSGLGNCRDLSEPIERYMTDCVQFLYNVDYKNIMNKKDELGYRLEYFFNGTIDYKGKDYTGLKRYSLDVYGLNDPNKIKDSSDIDFINYLNSTDDQFENFEEQWIKDIIKNKVIVSAKFFTNPNLRTIININEGLRGTLRIKFDSFANLSEIPNFLFLADYKSCKENRVYDPSINGYIDFLNKYEDVYKDISEYNFKIGQWYDIDVEIETVCSFCHGIIERAPREFTQVHVIDIREID